MKTLKLIVVGLALGYSALACGPDSVTNYYGTNGKGGSGASGSYYTCDDLGQAQLDCLSRKEPLGQDYATAVADVCRKKGLSQDCIDCVATAPCTFVPGGNGEDPHFKTPLNYCFGICPL